MPSLEGATEWFNATGAHAEAEAKGRPTLVHFWSVSCGLCKKNIPRVGELRDEREREGLRVIAVHMPLQESDADVEAVRDAVMQQQIKEPCAVDNQHVLRDAFQNDKGYVPAYYLFDAEGRLRGFAAGEHGLSVIVPVIDRVLSTKKESATEGSSAK